ncbi:hypothetical protein WAF17_06320 [Bernardetia sp. ABR2-2B]|uniref:hypothetical protein n=1 Tax=Bernardetia sp. ABR2-2B TaxID=3127472 RepID=UPI0030CE4A22
MENVLDFEDKPKEKGSWKPVLITNGVLLLILFILCYHFLFSEFEIASYSIKDTFLSIFMIACFGLTLLNILLLFISLFFSKKYWKKWLIMAACGFLLFALILLVSVIMDFSKLL